MPKHTKKKSKIRGFKKFYLIYLCVILIVLFSVFLSVDRLMVRYEAAVPENKILNMLNSAGPNDKSLGQYLQENCFSDALPGGKVRSTSFYNKVAFSELEVKKDLLNTDEELVVYSVTADEKPFLTVALRQTGSENALGGLLKIADYDLEYAYLRNEDSTKKNINFSDDGTISFSVVLPEDFKLLFDGCEVDLSSAKADIVDDFQSVNSYDFVPKAKRMEFSLNYEPVVSFVNNEGEPVNQEFINSTYYAFADYAASDEAKSLIEKNFDPLAMNEFWAEFMIDNVDKVNADNGFSKVISTCKILNGSTLYNQAKSWAYGIEIDWVSDFSSEWFTDEKVENYVMYNDDFCSCDVSFTHHIYVTFGGTYGDQPVEYATRMFFVRSDGSWYWAGSLNILGRE